MGGRMSAGVTMHGMRDGRCMHGEGCMHVDYCPYVCMHVSQSHTYSITFHHSNQKPTMFGAIVAGRLVWVYYAGV